MSALEEKQEAPAKLEFALAFGGFLIILVTLVWLEPFFLAEVEKREAEKAAWIQSVNEKCESLGGTPLWDRSGTKLMDCAGAVGILQEKN